MLSTHLNDGGRLPERSRVNNAHAYLAAPYGIYQTTDGNLAIAMGSVVRLGELLGCQPLTTYTDPKTWFTKRDEIKQILADHLQTNTTAHWLSILEPADVWCSDVFTWHKLLAHDGFRVLDMVQQVSRANGAPGEDLVQGMRGTISAMEAAGTRGFADFREGGIPGVRALAEAAAGLSCRPVILGREGGELVADGAGISSVRDVPGLEAVVAEVRRAGKILAIHAGERDPGDVDAALSYTPDLLVHGTHATRKQLRRISDEGIPIAVCPRSNWIFGMRDSARRPPLKEMIDLGCRIFIGTDNCMAVQPDLWREMSFISTVYGLDPGY